MAPIEYTLLNDSVQMKKLYSWHDVAERTEIVYDRALKCSNQSLIDRLPRYSLTKT